MCVRIPLCFLSRLYFFLFDQDLIAVFNSFTNLGNGRVGRIGGISIYFYDGSSSTVEQSSIGGRVVVVQTTNWTKRKHNIETQTDRILNSIGVRLEFVRQ